MKKKGKIPEPTVARLPAYFRCLVRLKDNDVAVVSSKEMSLLTGVQSSQFRKDMSYFGEFGIQGLGYHVQGLIKKLASILQLDKLNSVVIVGVGNMGSALIRYPGFLKWNFDIKYVYDNDPRKIGKEINGMKIKDIRELTDEKDASIGIITVPRQFAQETADRLIRAGIKSLLNFTDVKLDVSSDVIVRNVYLPQELALLNYYRYSG
jgi:redox-sensing transcriptional repressor